MRLGAILRGNYYLNLDFSEGQKSFFFFFFFSSHLWIFKDLTLHTVPWCLSSTQLSPPEWLWKGTEGTCCPQKLRNQGFCPVCPGACPVTCRYIPMPGLKEDAQKASAVNIPPYATQGGKKNPWLHWCPLTGSCWESLEKSHCALTLSGDMQLKEIQAEFASLQVLFLIPSGTSAEKVMGEKFQPWLF